MKTELPSYRTFATAVALLLSELAFWGLVVAAWLAVRSAAPNVVLDRPEWVKFIVLLPLATGIFLWSFHWKSRALKRLGDARLVSGLLPRLRPRRETWRFVLWRTALACTAIALLDPKLGTRMEEVTSEGIDVVVALDVSNSMRAEDVGMDRLALARMSVKRLLNQLEGDRVGLVVFAGDAYVQCPITTDHAALQLFLDNAVPELMPTQGTAVGTAIDLSVTCFDPESPASKTILVLTDGENHEDDAVAAAEAAAAAGIEVHAIGMGSPAGAPVPDVDRFGRTRGFKTDASGQPVVSALDEAGLIRIADAGNGTFTRAGKGSVNLNPLLEAWSSLTTAEQASVAFTDYIHRFPIFLFIALGLLLLETLLSLAPSSSPPTSLGFLFSFLVSLPSPLLPAPTSLLFLFSFLFSLPSPLLHAQTDRELKGSMVAGTSAYRNGDAAGAAALFGAAKAHSILGPVAAYNEGRALMDTTRRAPGAEVDPAVGARNAAARRSFQEAIASSKTPEVTSKAWYNIGNTHLYEENLPAAAEAFKQALRANPRNEEARHNLALTLRKQEQQQQQQQQQKQGGGGDQKPQQGGGQGQDQQGKQGPQGQQNSPQQGKGKISPEDAERMLENLGREEAGVQARMREQKPAVRKPIEKDW
ncbi:MAG: VWA domain-containing protein [Flavobacteriales bacterium]